MAEYCLAAEEVLYLAAAAGADMFYGIPDTLSGLSDQELKLKVIEMEEALLRKGYLEEDFDGNRSVLPELMKMIEHCGNCERFLCFEKAQIGKSPYACMYFLSGRQACKMECGKWHILSEIDIQAIRKEIEQGIAVKKADKKEGGVFYISPEELEKAAVLARRGSAEKGMEVLQNAGASDFISQAVINGILNKADFYALLFMDLRKETDLGYSVQFLSGEALTVMEYDTQEDKDFIKFSVIHDTELKERLKAGFEKLGCIGADEQFM